MSLTGHPIPNAPKKLQDWIENYFTDIAADEFGDEMTLHFGVENWPAELSNTVVMHTMMSTIVVRKNDGMRTLGGVLQADIFTPLSGPTAIGLDRARRFARHMRNVTHDVVNAGGFIELRNPTVRRRPNRGDARKHMTYCSFELTFKGNRIKLGPGMEIL